MQQFIGGACGASGQSRVKTRAFSHPDLIKAVAIAVPNGAADKLLHHAL